MIVMKKKIIWFLISCLMALSLVLASCGTGVTEEKEEKEEVETGEEDERGEEKEEIVTPEKDMVKLTLTKRDGTGMEKMVEKPRYGGTLTYALSSDPSGSFDGACTSQPAPINADLIGNELLGGDWTTGLAGTEETSNTIGILWKIGMNAGELAESYELTDDETIIFHIRKGIKWQNIPPVNGREFTAEDAAWNIERIWKSEISWLYLNNGPTERLISAKALDKYTLELKVPPAVQGLQLFYNSDLLFHLPPEVVETYGDMNDWERAIGTGPFIVDDYVKGSCITHVRNPDYFQEDPLFPENQLPYLDVLKQLIIPDASTRLAALRTAKVDTLGMMRLEWEDAELLQKSHPDLVFKEVPGYVVSVTGRIDKEDLPFKDVRVRRALNMAVNKQEMVDEYWGGHAMLFAYPYTDDIDHREVFVPLEEMSQEAQDIYTYDPAKAKELLAEAGYPDGFQTEIVCQVASADIVSLIREYYLAVGVDMEIQPLEPGVYWSVDRGRTYEEMIYKGTKQNQFPYVYQDFRAEANDCASFFDSPETRAAYNEMNIYLGKDDDKVAQILRDITPFMVENAWGTWLPAPYQYGVWWPWVKNFENQTLPGYWNPMQICAYMWMDQDLKDTMGY